MLTYAEERDEDGETEKYTERGRETETERGVNKVNYIRRFLNALFHS